MIERAERILREQGAFFGNVVRTWFYLSDILSWYGEFNKVRNQKYGEFGIMPGPGDPDAAHAQQAANRELLRAHGV